MGARDVAICVLADARAGRRTAKRSIDELLGRYTVRFEDVGLASELVWGVVRHRLTLEAVLQFVVTAKWERLSPTMQHVLLVAAYQLLCLDGVPAFAVIHEAVEQAKREGGRPAGGFVNAALRTLQRRLIGRGQSAPGDDPRTCVRIGPQRTCRFDGPVLPDPTADRILYLSVATSHPTFLVERWTRAFGPAAAESLCRIGTCRPAAVLRPNRLRTDAAALAARLATEGCEVEVVGDEAVVLINPPAVGPILAGSSFREGLFQPQDITAMHAVRLADPKPGAVVLDLCAGFGTKATQAAERMRDQGVVLASDSDSRKLKSLQRNCQRLGLTCVRPIAVDALDAAVAAEPRLDVILIDVPCSNTGVLARRPEARYRVSRRSLAALATAQRSLLERAASLARRETRLVYSTCSVEREENEAVVDSFRQGHREWRIVRMEKNLPQAGGRAAQWRDGGFVALLVRV